VSTGGYDRAQPNAPVPVITGTRGSERSGSPAIAGFSLRVGREAPDNQPPQPVLFLIAWSGNSRSCGSAEQYAAPTNQHVHAFVKFLYAGCMVVCRGYTHSIGAAMRRGTSGALVTQDNRRRKKSVAVGSVSCGPARVSCCASLWPRQCGGVEYQHCYCSIGQSQHLMTGGPRGFQTSPITLRQLLSD
jgi:hypothetical protein